MRLWKRKRERDAMETNAADSAGLSEAELSRERARKTREQVIRPLRKIAEHNQFADMIRASLLQGHRDKE